MVFFAQVTCLNFFFMNCEIEMLGSRMQRDALLTGGSLVGRGLSGLIFLAKAQRIRLPIGAVRIIACAGICGIFSDCVAGNAL